MRAIHTFLLSSLFAGAAATFCSAAPVVVVGDTFSNTDPATGNIIAGRTPEIDLSGNNYVSSGNTAVWGEPMRSSSIGNPGGGVSMQTDVGVAIGIGSAGAYVRPSVVSISADLNAGSLTQNDNLATRVMGLGFFSTNSFGHGLANHGADDFYGLALSLNGTLTVVSNGATAGTSAAYPGGAASFDPSKYHTLSYSIDTSQGSISGVTLDGQAVAGLSSSAFTLPNTVDAGFYVASSQELNFGSVDNFVVSIPEPSSMCMLAVLAVGPLMVRRRHVSK